MATWTQADIDALKAAIRTGVRRVHYSGPPAREVEYQSLAEMRSLLAEMQQSVSGASGGKSYRFVQTSKGTR